MCTTLFGCVFSFLLGKYLGLELLGHGANMLKFIRNSQTFSKVTLPFFLYPDQQNMRILVSLSDFHHSNGLNLHFPDS